MAFSQITGSPLLNNEFINKSALSLNKGDKALISLFFITGKDAMSLKKLMDEYAASEQLEQLEQDNNKFLLTVDGSIDIEFFQVNDRFIAYSILMKLPDNKNDREQLLQNLLERNLVLLSTERVSLCIDSKSNTLALYVSKPLGKLTQGEISDSVELLSNNHELFITLIKQSDTPSSPSMMMGP